MFSTVYYCQCFGRLLKETGLSYDFFRQNKLGFNMLKKHFLKSTKFSPPPTLPTSPSFAKNGIMVELQQMANIFWYGTVVIVSCRT